MLLDAISVFVELFVCDEHERVSFFDHSPILPSILTVISDLYCYVPKNKVCFSASDKDFRSERDAVLLQYLSEDPLWFSEMFLIEVCSHMLGVRARERELGHVAEVLD